MDYLGYYALSSIASMMFMLGYIVHKTAFAKRKKTLKRVKLFAIPVLFFSPFVFLVALIELQPYRIDIYKKG